MIITEFMEHGSLDAFLRFRSDRIGSFSYKPLGFSCIAQKPIKVGGRQSGGAYYRSCCLTLYICVQLDNQCGELFQMATRPIPIGLNLRLFYTQ
ncbi:hypothetical protein BLOT_008930 [Blomia tropicalis]|nr:hypothetical protein BLOT_008930 [Blomia tropicalis]